MKLLTITALTLAITLLLPASALAATSRPVFASATLAPSTSAARWLAIDVGDPLTSFNDSIANPIPISGTVQKLYVEITVAPGVGNSWAFSLYDQTLGTDTTLTCTIAGAATSCNDTTHTVTLTSGHSYAWHSVPTGTPAAMTMKLSGEMTGTNTGENALMGSERDGTVVGTSYVRLTGGSDTTGAESSVAEVAPNQFAIDNLKLVLTGATGVSTGFTATIFVNGSSSPVTCTVPVSSVTCSDTTHSITVYRGDTVSLQLINSEASTRTARWGMRIVSAVDGEFPLMGSLTNTYSASGTRYPEFVGQQANNSVETDGQLLSPTAWTLKNAFWWFNVAPGSGKSWTINSRVNSADGAITGSVADTAVQAEDTAHTISVVAGDKVNWATVPVNTPTAGAGFNFRFSAVSYIAPAGGGTNPQPPAGLANSQFRIFGGLFKIIGGHFVIR